MNSEFSINTSGVRTRPIQGAGAPRKLLHYLGDGEALLEIDNSSLEYQATCDKKAEWALVFSRIGVPSYALTYGGAVHKALEAYYRSKLPSQHEAYKEFDFQSTLTEVHKIFEATPPPLGHWRNFDKLCGMFGRYVEDYAPVADRFLKYVECEQAFSLPLTTIDIPDKALPYKKEILFDNPDSIEDEWLHSSGVGVHIDKIHIAWTGLIDNIVDCDGRIFILDHKTTSVEGEDFWKDFELRSQFYGYVYVAQKLLGRQVAGAIPNVIYGREDAKTPAGLKTQREKEFSRRYIEMKPELIEEWSHNTINILEDFINNLVHARWPMKTFACTNKFGICQFHDVCTLKPEQRLLMLMTNQYQTNIWNPLA
jgi:hypothetical protein